MLWKLYFGFILLITVLAIFTFYGTLSSSKMTLGDLIGITLNIMMLVALYSYAFKKEIGNPGFWKAIFAVLIVFFLFEIISYSPLGDMISLPSWLQSSSADESGRAISKLIEYAFLFPIYYATYKLAFSAKK